MITFLLVVATAVFLFLAIDGMLDSDGSKTFVCSLLAIALGFVLYDRVTGAENAVRTKWAEEVAKQVAIDEKLAVPQVLSTSDGCTVYKFKDGGYWHYFTKCDKDVTTDSTRTVRNGKTTSTKIESIVTQR